MITNFKNNKLLMIGTILSVAYIIFAWIRFGIMLSPSLEIINESTNKSEGLIAVISVLLLTILLPHLIVSSVGVILNLIGAGMNKRGLILASAILYAVSLVLGNLWAWALIPGVIFMFIAFAKMPKKKISTV